MISPQMMEALMARMGQRRAMPEVPMQRVAEPVMPVQRSPGVDMNALMRMRDIMMQRRQPRGATPAPVSPPRQGSLLPDWYNNRPRQPSREELRRTMPMPTNSTVTPLPSPPVPDGFESPFLRIGGVKGQPPQMPPMMPPQMGGILSGLGALIGGGQAQPPMTQTGAMGQMGAPQGMMSAGQMQPMNPQMGQQIAQMQSLLASAPRVNTQSAMPAQMGAPMGGAQQAFAGFQGQQNIPPLGQLAGFAKGGRVRMADMMKGYF